MRSLKVMTWVNMNPRKLGTVEEYCLVLSEELTSRGHSSLLAFSRLPPKWLSERFCCAGAEVISVKLNNTLATGLTLLKTARRYKVDIIHGTFIPLFSPLNIFMRLSYAKRIIFSDQTSRRVESIEPYKKLIRYLKTKVLGSCVDVIIADAKFIRDNLMIDDHVSPTKIITLYNGVNLSRFRPSQDGESVRREFNIRPETSIVTTVAFAIPEKGLDTYLRAAREVLKEGLGFMMSKLPVKSSILDWMSIMFP